MKGIFVFFVCCFAVTLAWSGQEEDRRRENGMVECSKEMKLSEEEARDPSNFACLLACMHKKVGYLNADGSINVEGTTHHNPSPRLRELVYKVFNQCVETAKGDPCQVSLCLENTKVA